MRKINTILKITVLVLTFLATESICEASNHFYSKAVTQTSGSGSGTAYVCTGESWTGGTNTSATKDEETNDSYYDFKYTVKATPSSGSHFSGWSISGATISSTTNQEAVVTVKATSETSSQPTTGTATAQFDLNKHTAKLSVAKSQAGTGTSSSATVQTKYGSGSWGSTASWIANSGDSSVIFNIKATPNTGYIFSGWATSDNSTTYFSTDAETTYTVKSPSTEGTTNSKTVYAVFNHSTFTVVFNKNEKTGWPVTGTMQNQTITSGVPTALRANNYSSKLTINYDSQGGTSISPMQKERFTRWKLSGSDNTYYSDQHQLDTLVNNGNTVTLNATWAEKVSVQLPAVSKSVNGVSLICLGWYDAASGGNKIGDPNQVVNIGHNGTNVENLYAQWQASSITINTTTSTGFTAGDEVIFNVKRGGNIIYRVPVTIAANMSVTINDIEAGEYEISLDEWSWNYTASAAQTKSVNKPTTFNFTLTPKQSEKKHDETVKNHVFSID